MTEYLSYSELAAFESCRLRWAVEYAMELRVPGPDSAPLRTGQLAHELARALHDDGEDAAQNLVKAHISDHGASDVQHRAWEAAWTWYSQTRLWLETAHSVEFERYLERELARGVVVRGQVDVTVVTRDGKRHLVDIKTTSKAVTTAARGYESSRQLMLYDWLDGCLADRVRYDVVSTLGLGSSRVERDPYYDRGEFVRWLSTRAAEAIALKRALGGRPWHDRGLDALAHVHDGCAWCPLDELCRRRRSGEELAAVRLEPRSKTAHYRTGTPP